MITLSIPIALNASPAAVQQLLLLANEVAGFPTNGGVPASAPAPAPAQAVSQPAALMQSDALVQDSVSTAATTAVSPVEEAPEAPGTAVAPSGDAPVKRKPGRPPGTTKAKPEAAGITPPPQQMLSNGAVDRGGATAVQNPAMPPSSAAAASAPVNGEISREDLAAVWEAANEHNKPEAINLMRGTTLPNGDPKPKWFTPAQVTEPFISRMYHELVALLPTA